MQPPPPIDHLTYQVLSDRHLRVNRIDGGDRIGWDELQAVKNEAFGEDVLCIELYPAAGDTINEARYRHLWRVESDDLPNTRGLFLGPLRR